MLLHGVFSSCVSFRVEHASTNFFLRLYKYYTIFIHLNLYLTTVVIITSHCCGVSSHSWFVKQVQRFVIIIAVGFPVSSLSLLKFLFNKTIRRKVPFALITFCVLTNHLLLLRKHLSYRAEADNNKKRRDTKMIKCEPYVWFRYIWLWICMHSKQCYINYNHVANVFCK